MLETVLYWLVVYFLNGETSSVVALCKLDNFYCWQADCRYSLHTRRRYFNSYWHVV